MTYTLTQWILLFYSYCLLGWIWESCYVSAKKHTWINRGFLHGPFLPLYGSGAILVLFITQPFTDNLILIYFSSMIAATILEYITGVTMERLFHVRYWDYSSKRFNINGHICLGSTIAWGFFAIGLIKILNPPISHYVTKIPESIAEPIAFVITIFITIDGVVSFYEAMDLRDVLAKLTATNEDIKRIQRRLEIIVSVVGEDAKEFKDKLANGIEENIPFIKMIKESETTSKLSAKKSEFAAKLEERRKNKTSLLDSLAGKLHSYQEILTNLDKNNITKEVSNELEQYDKIISEHSKSLNNSNDKKYLRSIKILKRNPNASTKKYKDALAEIKELKK